MTTTTSTAASAAFRRRAPAPAAPKRALIAVALLLAAGAALYQGLLAASHSGARAVHRRAPAHSQGLLSLPAAAQGPVSRALGADNPAYRVRPSWAGFAASNTAQRLRVRFGLDGLSVSSGATRVGLRLQAIGSGPSLVALPAVAPRGRANRVIYQHPGLSEWYANGPLGLEQGFTVTHAPAAHAAGPLTLAMALSGGAHAALAGGAQSLTLRGPGGPKLRYSGLTATDAAGRALHSWLALEGGRLLLRVDSSHARFPVRIDPFVQQGEKLTGAGERGEAGEFGFSVAISPDGNTALIGGPSDNGFVGAAWIFTRASEKWTQQGPKLTGKEESGAGEFGFSVALSEGGTYAVIGGPSDNERVGAAWVFLRSGEKWTQQGPKLTGKEEVGEAQFGRSVAVAAKEGNYVLIGGSEDNGAGALAGAGWVFLRSGTTWSFQAKLTGKEEVGEGQFGTSVALSAEGTYALLGGPADNLEAGAAWVETRSGTAWSFQAKLTGKEENGKGRFGASVALSAEGTYALVGGPRDKEGLGAAWVETRSGTAWSYQAKLAGTSEVGNSEFGASVALAAKTAEYALIGGPSDNGGVGAAWVQSRSGTTWSSQAKLTGSEEAGNGEFGFSVAMSQEGKDALVGGPSDNARVGAAWVLTRSGSAWNQQAKLTGKEEVGEGEIPGAGRFGYSVAISPDGNTALIGGPSDGNGAGAAWMFTRASEKWTQQGAKLTGNEENGAAEFGYSVALSEGGTYAVIGGPHDNEKAGAAWVFLRSGEKWTQQAKLTGSSEVGAGELGRSVAVASKTGEYALIGGPGDSTNAGAGWVFLRSGTAWSFQAKLTGKEEVGEGQFGASVALSSEGTYALIGGPGDSVNVGAAWVETRSGTTWSFQAKLTAGKKETGAGLFGASVALSSEATYGLIGGPDDAEALGAAWVETRSGTAWSLQAKLTGQEEIGKGEFGASVALATKTGEYALIGGPADNTKVGAAWVEIRSGTTWSFQAKLAGVAETGKGELGASVAMSQEGKDALIGAPSDRKKIGGAWVFTRSGTAWSQQGEKLTGGGESGTGEAGGKGQFGFDVAISAEGNTALIGGPATLGSGAGWVFVRSGATWSQQGAKITPAAAEQLPPDGFGRSVALSSDGNTALIGAPNDNANVGAAWVFTRSGEKWTQQGTKITGGGQVGAAEFGASVALSSDGNTAAIGGPNDGAFTTGATWVFTRASEKWSQQGEKLTGATVNGRFGEAVALSSSGNTALVGEPLGNGAARVFIRLGSSWFQQGSALTGKEETGEAEFGDAVALSADGNTALIGGPIDNLGAGAAWAFTRSGEAWTQQGAKLTGKEATGESQFGTGVALSSDGNTALIGGPADNGHVGAAWVETRSGTAWSQLGGKLTAKEEVGEGEFGATVALSAEGNYALLGGFADNRNVGAAWVFLQNQPTVTTGAASSIAQTTATMNATVNPNGGNVTECKFEYGTTESYGSSATCSPSPGSGTSPVAVSAAVAELAPNTTYHFRIFAKNAGGTSQGADKTFKTLPSAPTVKTEAASSVGTTTATLNATVNPNGGNVSECTLEYGTTISYGSSVTCTPLPGSGSSPVAVTAALTGLTPNTTYHFRISATNAGGTSKGSDETLKTLPNAPTVKTEAASSIGKTTATLNATVNPNGGNVSECKLEYGTTTSYGSSAGCVPSPGSGESPVAVSAAVSGLTPNTTYHFRISATNAGGNSTGSDQPFNTALPNAPTVTTEAATAITKTSATLHATVNPNGGNVTQCIFEYGETMVYVFTAPCTPSPGSGNSPVAVSATITGLGVNTTWHYRISATNAGGTSPGADESLKTLPNAPTVKTEAASSVGSTTATLNATVNPNAGNVTECKLEYGTTEAYGSSAPCSSLPGSGTSPVAVSASVSGLNPLTTYHFRISATNAGGTSTGSDESLKTLPSAPTVKTEAPSAITKTSATLNATVNPNSGNVTECTFEYGTTTSYGFTVPCTPSPGSGSSPVAVSAALTGFSPNATWHYRISATNAGGTSKGSDETLKTLPNAPTVKTEAASSIGQTTATLNGTVNPNGANVSECKLEYGTTTSYGSSAACVPSPGSGESAVTVSAAVSELTPATTYHFRISATNAGGTSTGSDGFFKTALPPAPTVKTEAATGITKTSATLHATVNPNGGNVTECIFEYGGTVVYFLTVPCTPSPGSGNSPVAVSGTITGLEPNTTWHYRIFAKNAGGEGVGADETLKTLPNAPSVTTEAASSVGASTATLNATVNPNGGNVSECKLEYGTTTSYGSSAPCSSLPGAGTSPVSVSASVSGLSGGTTYHFRITATNAGGTSLGEDKTFTTLAAKNPPTVTTAAASSVTRTLATLNGTVNPNGSNVSECKFEYGTTTSYGSTVRCASPPGSGESAVAATAALGNLSPNTTYHFRLSATNAGGTSTGSDQSFTTLAALPTPHWYKNGVKAALGERVGTIGWGTLTLESSAGTATCHSAEAANVENTAGAARREVVLFSAFECKPIGGSCTGGEQRATPGHMPWQGTMLEEGVEGSEEFREEGWGIEINLECFKGGVNTANQLFKTGPVLAETGTSTPVWLNGTTATKPAELSFDASSGHLYAEVEKAALKGTTKGKLKFVGYQDNAAVPVISVGRP